jgi:hypothetical protein
MTHTTISQVAKWFRRLSHSRSSRTSGRKRLRRLLIEGLEQRNPLAVTAIASQTTIYEGGTPSDDGARPKFSELSFSLAPTRSYLTYEYIISGDLASVGLTPNFEGTKRKFTNVPVVLQAANDPDLANHTIQIVARLTYSAAANDFEDSSPVSISVIDNDSIESMNLTTGQGSAREPAVSYACQPAQPATSGTFQFSVPEHWKGGSIDVVVGGNATLNVDYSLSLDPLPNGVDPGNHSFVPKSGVANTFVWTIPSKIYINAQNQLTQRNFSSVQLRVTPLADSIVDPGENVTLSIASPAPNFEFSWNESELQYQPTPNPSYDYTLGFIITPNGSASVAITDDDGTHGENGYSFSANPSTEKETETDEAQMGKFVITPTSAACSGDSLYIRINEWTPGNSSKRNAATYGVDYFLKWENGSAITMTPDGYGWRSDTFNAPTSGSLKIVVVPINDALFEGSELVEAELWRVKDSSIPSHVDRKLGTATVSIVDQYVSASVTPKYESNQCSTQCVCVCGNEMFLHVDPRTGQTEFRSDISPLRIRNSSTSGTTTTMQIGLPMYADKSVPSSIQLTMELVQDSPTNRTGGTGLGNSSIGTLTTLNVNLPSSGPDVVTAGDMLWLPVTIDVGKYMTSGGAASNRNAVGDQLLNFRLVAHPNFPQGTNLSTSQRISGWLGYGSTIIVSPTSGGFNRDTPAAMASVPSGPVPENQSLASGPPGVDMVGSYRAILGATSLKTQDSFDLPTVTTTVNGVSTTRVGDAVVTSGIVNAKPTRALIDPAGRLTMFIDNDTDPTSLSTFTSNTLKDRYGNQ